MHYTSANVKKLIDSLGLSLSEFARQTGVNKATLSRWFSEDKVPRLDMLEKIATRYNIPLDYFTDEPVYDVAAGSGRINSDYPSEYLSEKLEDGYSYVRIHGDSMLPNIKDGDIVKVHHQTETKESDFTVVKVDGESATVKHVEIVSDGVWLRADNKEVFPDKFFTIQEVMTLPVTIIGKAVEVRREL